jgi:hypothetical protein
VVPWGRSNDVIVSNGWLNGREHTQACLLAYRVKERTRKEEVYTWLAIFETRSP